jgi:hypothetical protein
MNIITVLGLSVIFLYSLTQILKFYGIGEDTYGIYVLFFVFVVISGLILPKKETKI